MLFRKALAGIGACMLLCTGCYTACRADILQDEAMAIPDRGDWTIGKARYTVFAKPPAGWVGDVMPMGGAEDEDVMRLFYLQDWRDGAPTYHPFHSFTTSDFVHYEYQGEAIPVTNPDDYDLALGTGSVTKVGDVWHAFYTGNNPRWFAAGKNREYIRHAVSTDLKTFTKIEEDTFTASLDLGYDRENFRDPFLFWNEEKGEWWLLITAVRNRRGVLARYRSTDLSSWEIMEPLVETGGIMECPDLFRWGDYWYCVYSTDWTTRYMRAKSLDGPWEHPPMTAFDSHAFYAAKTGVLNGKRYLCGWIGTRGGYSREFKDTSEWDWAGNLAVYELEQDADGWLKIHLPDTIRDAFGPQEQLTFKTLDGEARAEGDTVTLTGDMDSGAVCFGNLPAEPVLLTATVRLSADARAAGFFFGGSGTMKALAVELDMKHGLLRYDNSLVARMRYATEESRISRRIDTKERTYRLEVLIDQDIAVFFLDGREALSTRIYKMPLAPWGVYVTGGECTFENLTMRKLVP